MFDERLPQRSAVPFENFFSLAKTIFVWVDEKKLEAFVKVVDLGSISRAARALHLTQSALSQQITQLETTVAVQLLERSKQGVAPTQAGRVFYRHAQHLLRGIHEALTEVRSRGAGLSGRVSVGLAPHSVAQNLTIPLLRAVRHAYPNIVLHIRENFGGLLSEGIATGQIDMGVIYSPAGLRAVRAETVYVDELWVLAHRKRNLPTPVDFADLVEMPLILPTRQHSIRLAIDAAFSKRDLFPRIAGEVEQASSIFDAVAENIACAILPATSMPKLEDYPDLRQIQLVEVTPIRLSFCTSANEPLTEAASAIEQILRELLANQLTHLSGSR